MKRIAVYAVLLAGAIISMKVIDYNGSSLGSDSDYIQSVPIETVGERVKPRAIGTGAVRGQQTILGAEKSRIVSGTSPGTPDEIGINFFDDEGTRRFLVGDYPNGEVKMKLSQAGADVRTATDDQLIWSSDFKSFKIVATDSLALAGTFAAHPTGSYSEEVNEATYTHNLGYAPSFIAYFKDENDNHYLPGAILNHVNDASRQQWLYLESLSTTTQFVARVRHLYRAEAIDTSPVTYNLSVKFYLIRETAN